MATAKARIQVTVDDELAAALQAADPAPASRSRLVRDLAVRGAEALRAERDSREQAIQVLIDIAEGRIDYDFEGAAATHAARGDHLL